MDEVKGKTILYIITKSNWGGAQRYVYDLACAALAEGYTPIVACGGTGTLTERLTKQSISTQQIRSLERDGTILKDLYSFFEIMRIIRATQPAIVHVNSSKAGGIGALAARLCSTACIVFTVHGLPQNEVRGGISKKIIAVLTWLTAVLAHRVITVAHADTVLLQKKPFLRKKIQHIQNGIEYVGQVRITARQQILQYISDASVRKRLADAFWIGTVAELTANKGHRYALEAFIEVHRQYPNVTYIIVGDGELASECKTFVQKHDLQDHVFFTGFIPNAAELYSAFDVYLAPSIKEGLPYTILEAMCSGLPVVASRIGGIPDVLTHSINGHLIAPHSPVAITDALVRMIKNSAYRVSLGENARTHALTACTKSVMVERTFLLYKNCTQRQWKTPL